MHEYDMNPAKTLRIYKIFLLCLLINSHALAQDYESGRSAYISGDYERALEILKPLAEDGDSEAQKVLGIMYDYGHGVEKDQQQALYWYIKSAEQGNPAVQYQVGAKYFRGEGTQQDYAEAGKWWELAANGGQVDAQFNLGLMYYRGLSVERDDIRAVRLFQQAAEQGHSYAQYSLAVMYSFGQGVEKSYDTALKWFRKSAEQGVAQAQFNMGVYYENGYGVEPDIETARSWYERASAQGLEEATNKLAELTAPVEEFVAVPEPTVAEAPQDIKTEPATTVETLPERGIKRERWVLSQAPDSYTLQIGSVTNERDIIKFIEEYHIESEAAYIKVVIGGITRYNAVYGVYQDFSEATAAISNLPAGIRKVKPWVRNFGILQKMLD